MLQNQSHDFGIGLAELGHVYDLSTFGNSRFLVKVKTNKSSLILKSKHNDGVYT